MLDQPSAVVKRFFWLLFFAQAKKSNSPQAKAFALAPAVLEPPVGAASAATDSVRKVSRLKPLLQKQTPKQKKQQQRLPPLAGHFSLLAQRKVTKRKRALPCALRAARSGSADAPGIRGRGILPLPRTAHILVRRPSGFSPAHPPLRKGTRESKATAEQQQQQSNSNSRARAEQKQSNSYSYSYSYSNIKSGVAVGACVANCGLDPARAEPNDAMKRLAGAIRGMARTGRKQSERRRL